MKKPKDIIKIIIIIALLVSIGIASFFVAKMVIDRNLQREKRVSLLWDLYDLNTNKIKQDMDKITVWEDENYWLSLKDNNINDKNYKNSLDSLVAYIRQYYLILNDDGTNYTDTIYFTEFRKNKTVSKKDFKFLKYSFKDSSLIEHLSSYKTLLISDDEELANEFRQITENVSNNLKENNNRDALALEDILIQKNIELENVLTLTNFLKEKYYENL